MNGLEAMRVVLGRLYSFLVFPERVSARPTGSLRGGETDEVPGPHDQLDTRVGQTDHCIRLVLDILEKRDILAKLCATSDRAGVDGVQKNVVSSR